MLILSGQTYRIDPDAYTYIKAVEAADGQLLENKTRVAIDKFVRGCKKDGIWNAIKAACILAGARTLTGALVPLKGTAPTNFNFVSGDYNRKTGLKGDGSTKYLSSNRNNNADPQNSKHLSVYTNSTPTGATYPSWIGVGGYSVGASELATNNTLMHIRLNKQNATVIGSAGWLGFLGVVRSTSTSITLRGNNSNIDVGSNISENPFNGNLLVFRSSSGGSFNNSWVSFYSIGESLNLALLDSRITKLMTDINNAF